MDFDNGSLKPDILRTLDLTRMEKKPIDGDEGPAQQSVTDVEQSIGTIEPIPSPHHLEFKQKDRSKNLQVSTQQLPFTKYEISNDFK